MKNKFKTSLIFAICVILITSITFAAPILESIKVYRNQINIKINGTSTSVDNFTYNGTAYVSLRSISDKLGLGFAWDAKTNTASISSSNSSAESLIVKHIPGTIDAFEPFIDFTTVGLSKDRIDGYVLESKGEIISKSLELRDDGIGINDSSSAYGINVLDLNTEYTLKVFTTDNNRYRINFKTGGLASLENTGERRIVYVPAMPEKGFNWPYYLVLPSNSYESDNKNHKRYMVVDTTNTGSPNNDIEDCIKKTYDNVKTSSQASMRQAEELWAPFLMPVFPRPNIGYNYKNEFNAFYTHALDRDTATLHIKMKDRLQSSILTTEFLMADYEINNFYKLDQQLAAMIDHAAGYLNQYKHNVQSSKVFLSGYSASGTFTDRFATLHPDKVKAVASGATLDDMMLPLAQYKGKNLIFPIGTYDYKDITGSNFSMANHNKVARLLYMGEDDTNNTVPYDDCYGAYERGIITSLWGVDVLPRANALIKLYGESGGKGIFILDDNVEHGYSREMEEYALEFLKANRDSDQPVYPTPQNKNQLKYTLYR